MIRRAGTACAILAFLVASNVAPGQARAGVNAGFPAGPAGSNVGHLLLVFTHGKTAYAMPLAGGRWRSLHSRGQYPFSGFSNKLPNSYWWSRDGRYLVIEPGFGLPSDLKFFDRRLRPVPTHPSPPWLSMMVQGPFWADSSDKLVYEASNDPSLIFDGLEVHGIHFRIWPKKVPEPNFGGSEPVIERIGQDPAGGSLGV